MVIVEILLGFFATIFLILIMILVVILSCDTSTIKCHKCKTKVPHKGWDKVYCESCKVTTYEERCGL